MEDFNEIAGLALEEVVHGFTSMKINPNLILDIDDTFEELEASIKALKLEKTNIKLENSKLKRELQGWLEE